MTHTLTHCVMDREVEERRKKRDDATGALASRHMTHMQRWREKKREEGEDACHQMEKRREAKEMENMLPAYYLHKIFIGLNALMAELHRKKNVTGLNRAIQFHYR